MLIADTFQITGRGLVVAVTQTTDQPISKRLAALVIRPDGSSITANAFKERFLRKSLEPFEGEAFLLMGVLKEDVPIGSELRLSVAE